MRSYGQCTFYLTNLLHFLLFSIYALTTFSKKKSLNLCAGQWQILKRIVLSKFIIGYVKNVDSAVDRYWAQPYHYVFDHIIELSHITTYLTTINYKTVFYLKKKNNFVRWHIQSTWKFKESFFTLWKT